MFAVVANGLEKVPDGWVREFQVPTFYVQADSEQSAHNIARRILGNKENCQFFLSVRESL